MDIHPQLILTNAEVITMDDSQSLCQAVVVKDGRILAVGSSKEMETLAGPNTEVLDLMGAAVLPGFIEAHTHVDLVGLTNSDLFVDCRIPPHKDNEEVLAALVAKAASLSPGELVLGHARWVQPYLNRNELDAAVPDQPVILKYNMHSYLLNSVALRKFGISRDTPDIYELHRRCPGGQIQRDLETGEPTGFLDDAWDFLFPGSPSPFPYQGTKKALLNGLERHIRNGVTSITEFVDMPESPLIYQELRREEALKARLQLVYCVHGLHKTTDLESVLKNGLTTGFGDEWISFGGVKFFLDLGVDTTITSYVLKDMVRRAHKANVRVFMHSNTRKAQDMALEAIEQITRDHPGKDLRHRIEHMGNRMWDINYFDRVREAGAIALPTAYFMNIGRAFQPGIRLFVFRTMLDKGLCIPGNSDSGGTEPQAPNPLYQIWCMAARESRNGEKIFPEEAISVEEGLRIYTRHSAYATLTEDIKGSIEPGKLADFAVLEKNPLKCQIEELPHIKNLFTIVGGKVTYRAQA